MGHSIQPVSMARREVLAKPKSCSELLAKLILFYALVRLERDERGQADKTGSTDMIDSICLSGVIYDFRER